MENQETQKTAGEAPLPSLVGSAEGLREALERILGVIEAHEVTCFSCDRDGEEYCDCLDRESKRARAILSQNVELTRGADQNQPKG